MDRWQEIINYLDMTAEWVQVLIAFIALVAGLSFLSNHKATSRVDRNSKYSEDIIRNLYRIKMIAEVIFKNRDSFQSAAYMRLSSYPELPNELRDGYGKLALIMHALDDNRSELNDLFDQISVWSDFIKEGKNQDKKAQKFSADLQAAFGILSSRIVSNLGKIQEVSLSEIQDDCKDDFEAKTRIFQLKKQFKRFYPISYSDDSFSELNDFRKLWIGYKDYLLKDHVP